MIAGSVAGSLATSLARSAGSAGDGSSTPAPTKTFLQGATDASNATEYTFSGQSLGEAASDRRIIVCVHGRASEPLTISGVTVGGVAATPIVSVQAASQWSVAGIYICSVPTGATGDVVVTFSVAALRCAIQLYRATGIINTATDTGTSIDNPPSTTLTVPSNGIVIACASVAATSDNCAWTGVTEDYDAAVEALTTTSGSHQAGSATTLAITSDFTSTSSHLLAAAAWGA